MLSNTFWCQSKVLNLYHRELDNERHIIDLFHTVDGFHTLNPAEIIAHILINAEYNCNSIHHINIMELHLLTSIHKKAFLSC